VIGLGIDPGMSGCIATVGPEGPIEWLALNKVEDKDVWEWLNEHGREARFAEIEKVNAMPKQGVSSTFKFGRSFGFLTAMLVALEVKYDFVLPRQWQGDLGCLSKGDKNVTKAAAQRCFPSVKRMTHAIADGLLIAEHARRVRCAVLGGVA